MSLSTKSRPSSRSVTVKAVQKESERLWRKGFVKEMSFKSGIKGRGSDSSTENQLLFERAKLGGCDEVMRRMRWTRRRVNRILMLTE